MEQKHRILIIDDNKFIVTVLREFFERKYEVLTAYDGADGLQAFEDSPNSIDLVITDLIMPKLSGIGVISALKKKYPQVSIIAITGCCDEIDGTGFSIGADRFIEKPFDLGVLDKAVAELLVASSTTSGLEYNLLS